MQTNFTPEQLEDPAVSDAEKILRRCVHCGFCTATCPTYLVLGDERDSPRGRIYAIKDMLERGADATAEVSTHIDRCLSCFSCMTTCPSGVDYMHLVEFARNHIEKTGKRSFKDRLVRKLACRGRPVSDAFQMGAARRAARPAVGARLPPYRPEAARRDDRNGAQSGRAAEVHRAGQDLGHARRT